MPILALLRVVPIGTASPSLSSYVAKVIEVLRKRGVNYVLGPMGTSIEIDGFDELAQLLKEIVEVLRKEGVQRIAIDVSIDIRFDKELTLRSKVASVEQKLGHS